MKLREKRKKRKKRRRSFPLLEGADECSAVGCDVLTLYFTNCTSAPSRGFRLVLPLNGRHEILLSFSSKE
ncbi:hypothetical protein Y032_0275g1034 [Ancylostoma ceylanicum]|uniref:Uncharacterized protein n=1 Tax=Ancylostoma ceylanicum TaxID=53326 RepID=A0A016S7I6_9BILA|nr:hypothetical protein Y032_0275g1034 [Ancylostoma ceylanicum]